ncbi:secreted ookinete protein, putative [Plasmodium chabaudi adami]|uniref:Secreted ookinete protein, putative n=1 Tax=Plasmodium chabaudi adami TaxID=5826 RepID=A0A1D3RXS5_PLACE|nr:secreted ookinete protein, putative [Plasmodium chabaudi adami]
MFRSSIFGPLFLWSIFLIIKTNCFYFKVDSELISKDSNIRKCNKEHYLNFQGQIVQVCNDKIVTGSSISNNIYVSAYNKENKWEDKFKLLNSHTQRKIEYFYSFITNESLVIVYCFSKSLSNPPYECHNAISTDLVTFTTQRISISFSSIDPLSLQDYSLSELEIFEKKYILICGLDIQKQQYEEYNKFILCNASSNGGVNWTEKFTFYVTGVDPKSKYTKLVPKINGNEIGFLYYSEGEELNRYLKCKYKDGFDYECYLVGLARLESYMWDISKIRGYYISIISNNKQPPHYIYYMHTNIYTIPLEAPTSMDANYERGNLFPLDSYRLIYNYVAGENSYTYILKHVGAVKYCALLYIKREHMNPGFVKSGNKYICTILYDDLIVDGEDRYFTLGAYNGTKHDIRKCFYVKLNRDSEPVNIIHKIESVYEYNNYRLYTLYIKKDLERYFIFDITLECYLGEDFFLRLKLYFKNNYVLQTSDLNKNQNSINLYNNNIIYFTLPSPEYEKTLMPQLKFPPYTRYVRLPDKNYVFQLPSYIKNEVTLQLPFVNKNNMSNQVIRNVVINPSTENTQNDKKMIGLDFSKANICDYANINPNCDNIVINENKINITIDTQTTQDIQLAIICPITKKTKNTCFNDIYTNKKKKFIRDHLKDQQGLLTIYPKMYIHGIENNDPPYEESLLTIPKTYIQMFNEKKTNYNNTFICKCYSNSILYEITYTFV